MERLGGAVLTRGDWLATVLPQFGCNLIQLSYREQEILRTPSCLAELEQSPYLYGSPILMPGNRVRDGRFSLHGQEYALPINEPLRGNHIHGLLYNANFTVAHQSQTTLRATLVNDGRYFPLPFTISICFELTAQGLSQELLIDNCGAQPLPVSLALHTTFCAPSSFSVPIGQRYGWDDRFLPTGELLPLDAHEREFVAASTSEGRVISGYYTAAGTTARLGSYYYRAEGFDHWVLYNGGGAQRFLCVEPQLGAVNALGDGTAPVLASGESLCLQVSYGRTSPA